MLTSDDIRALFRKHNATGVLSFCEPTLAAYDDVSPPHPNQTAAVAFHNPKTAALLFDRIWAGAKPDIPRDIGFRTASTRETSLVFLTALLFNLTQAADRGYEVDAYVERVGSVLLDLLPNQFATGVPTIDQYSKVIADSIGADYGISVVPVYSSAAQRDREYQAGDRSTVVAVLENVPVVLEADLSWEQVVELRRDQLILKHLRKFTHWLDGEMVGKPLSFIQDEINVRLAEFEEAARKHGVITTLGALHVTLETPAILGGAAYLAKLGAEISNEWAIVVGTAIAAARVSVHIAKQLLNVKEQRASMAGEIAYVIEVQRRVTAG